MGVYAYIVTFTTHTFRYLRLSFSRLSRFFQTFTMSDLLKNLDQLDSSNNELQKSFLESLKLIDSLLPSMERTFIAIKPDGVARNLITDIIARFEKRGYKLVAMKLMKADKNLLEKHYEEHVKRPFFPALSKFMQSGPVVAMIWEGKDVVKQGRIMLGATNPLDSAPGTIRGDFAIDLGRNVVHGS